MLGLGLVRMGLLPILDLMMLLHMFLVVAAPSAGLALRLEVVRHITVLSHVDLLFCRRLGVHFAAGLSNLTKAGEDEKRDEFN